MSRANVGDAFSRLRHRPPSEQLNEDIVRLRKTTRISLQISEHEVETLQRQCSIHTEAATQYDGALKQLREKKKVWQERCIAAETKLQEKEISKNRNRRLRTKSLSFSGRDWSWSDRNNTKDNTDRLTDEDLILKLSSRDQAISSLELALNDMSRLTQSMQVKIYEGEEKQRIKEKEIHDSHVQKEEHLKEIIDSLRKELANSVSRNET